MPATSERQRRFMAMCAHGQKPKAGCPKGMSKAKMREFSYKSHMPKGATQSPKGDLAARRVAEADSQRNIMHRGSSDSGSQYFASTVSAPGSMGEKEGAK